MPGALAAMMIGNVVIYLVGLLPSDYSTLCTRLSYLLDGLTDHANRSSQGQAAWRDQALLATVGAGILVRHAASRGG